MPSGDDASPAERAVSPARRRLHQAALFLFVLLSYWLYGQRPIAALPWSAVDDGLYLRHGQAFVQWVYGNNPLWLGPYDHFLLSKAPLYGLFLGVLNLLCVPVRIGEFLMLIGLPWFFARACRPIVILYGWKFALPACLLVWLPILPSETHLLRNGLQSILTSYFIIACIGLLTRTKAPPRNQLQWAAVIGVLFSLCYLNREEATWLILSVLLSFALFALLQWLNGGFSLPRIVLVNGTIIVFALPLISAVAAMNYQSYGAFLTTFRRSTAFVAAFQRLTSLEPEFQRRYIPIRRDTRYRAYDLSPAFARLKPILEDGGSYWVAGNEGHSGLNGYDPADKEFFISNFEFALQFAAFHSGARSASEAEALFAAIDRELAEAIRSGKITAGAHGPSILATVQAGDIGRIVRGCWVSFYKLLTLEKSELDWSARSSGEPTQLEQVSRFVHSSLVPEDPTGPRYQSARYLNSRINLGLRYLYPLAVPALLGLAGLALLTRKPRPLQAALIATVPLLSVVFFCLTMAIVNALGFQFLDGVGYNVLGYAPLSVLCAFTFVVGLTYLDRPATDDS